jgi:hypothetical protein
MKVAMGCLFASIVLGATGCCPCNHTVDDTVKNVVHALSPGRRALKATIDSFTLPIISPPPLRCVEQGPQVAS